MADNLFLLHREKVVLDSSIYIGHLNQGLYSELLAQLISSSIFYLHSTVFEELLAGARSDKEIKELHRLKASFLKKERILTPIDQDWEEAGILLNRLVRKSRLSPKNAVSLTHDVLIALSARRRGVRLITANRRDFERICAIKEFKLTIWRNH